MTEPTVSGRAIVDPGGQSERTRLSWNRTGLALAANAALLVHTQGGSLARHVPSLLMLLVAFGCFLFASRRYRRINAAVRDGRPVTSIAHVRVLAALSVLPAIIALVSVLT